MFGGYSCEDCPFLKGNGRGMDLGKKGSQWEGGQWEEWRTGNCSWNVLKTINKHFKLETRAAVAKGMRVGLQQTKELITAE